MSWHRVTYGTGDNVVTVCRTYDRKEAFSKARKTANETGRTVIVSWDVPVYGRGLEWRFVEVSPE